MKNKKWLIILGLVLVLCVGLAGCQSAKTPIEPHTVKVGTLSGPTGMGMSEMIVKGVDLGENVTTEFTIAGAPDQVTAGVISGDYQIAAVPTNLASVLYNKTEKKVALGGVNTLGVLYIVADENVGVNSIKDLAGKTMVATGQGSTPEYVLNYLLEKNGLTPGVDVTINYVAEHAEAATMLVSGQAQIAMIPEPFVTTVTTKAPNIKVSVNLSTAWEEANNGSKLEMGCLVVNKAWADANPELIKTFMKKYEESVNNLNKDPKAGAENVVAAGIMTDPVIAEKAIPNCNIVYISPSDAKADLEEYYNILAGFEPKAIGGKIPGEDFYNLKF